MPGKPPGVGRLDRPRCTISAFSTVRENRRKPSAEPRERPARQTPELRSPPRPSAPASPAAPVRRVRSSLLVDREPSSPPRRPGAETCCARRSCSGSSRLVFLAEPVLRFADHSFTTADFTQSYELTRVEPGHVPGNQLISDPVLEMQVWQLFQRRRAGRRPPAPLEPAQRGGAPHLANFQSAVFSPFSLPSTRWASRRPARVGLREAAGAGPVHVPVPASHRVRHAAALLGGVAFQSAATTRCCSPTRTPR